MIQIQTIGMTLPEVWIDGRYLRVRGNVLIRRAFAVNSNVRFPLAINFDDNELMFSHADAVGVEYDGGIYTKNSERWLVGRHDGEICRIYGFSKTYLSDSFEPLGFKLEVTPVDLSENSVKVEVTYNGEPAMCELKVRNGDRLTLIFMDNYREKIELKKGLNVITAKYVERFDKFSRCLLSTLTIKI